MLGCSNLIGGGAMQPHLYKKRSDIMRRKCKRCGAPSVEMEFPERFICMKCMTVNEAPVSVVVESEEKEDVLPKEEFETWDKYDSIMTEVEDDTEEEREE